MTKNPEHLRILLLAGGKSQRMGTDKASLLYNGQTQLERMVKLVQPLQIPVHLSLRPDQSPPEGISLSPILDRDEFANSGPLGGMLSALTEYPKEAFLVIACDLPFLDLPTLQFLINNRSEAHLATAFKSHHDGLPEPLCAIWEPHCTSLIIEKLQSEIRCPRKILIQETTLLLDLPNPEALDNINTPEEYEEALSRITLSK